MDDIPKPNKKLPFYFVGLLLGLLIILAGLFFLAFRPIEKKIIINKPTPTPILSLTELISQKNRLGIENWAKEKSISEINTEVDQLNQQQKNDLASSVLLVKGNSPNETKTIARDRILTILQQIFTKKDLGFYAEIFSYTTINIEGDSYHADCNQVHLSPDFNNLDLNLARDFLMHETFHSFNCVNSLPGMGHAGALDEGSAIWIFKTYFPEGRNPDELTGGWAETTYGTVNFYRDIGVPSYPRSIPLLAAENSSQKLKDVFNLLAKNDPSKLPWESKTNLTNCYNRYYKKLKRNVDFNLWLTEAAQKSKLMAQDKNCNS